MLSYTKICSVTPGSEVNFITLKDPSTIFLNGCSAKFELKQSQSPTIYNYIKQKIWFINTSFLKWDNATGISGNWSAFVAKTKHAFAIYSIYCNIYNIYFMNNECSWIRSFDALSKLTVYIYIYIIYIYIYIYIIYTLNIVRRQEAVVRQRVPTMIFWYCINPETRRDESFVTVYSCLVKSQHQYIARIMYLIDFLVNLVIAG